MAGFGNNSQFSSLSRLPYVPGMVKPCWERGLTNLELAVGRGVFCVARRLYHHTARSS